MDKALLQQQVLTRLEADLQQATHAAQVAYETATHEENIAENKYDTLGLEASYLATGQARRAAEVRQTIAQWRQLRLRPYDPLLGIQLGALIALVDADDGQQLFLLGPNGASMKLQIDNHIVQVISDQAPLGKAMLGKALDDDITLHIANKLQSYTVLWVQ